MNWQEKTVYRCIVFTGWDSRPPVAGMTSPAGKALERESWTNRNLSTAIEKYVRRFRMPGVFFDLLNLLFVGWLDGWIIYLTIRLLVEYDREGFGWWWFHDNFIIFDHLHALMFTLPGSSPTALLCVSLPMVKRNLCSQRILLRDMW